MSNVSLYSDSAGDFLLNLWQIAFGHVGTELLSDKGLKERLVTNLNVLRRRKYKTDAAMAEALDMNPHTLRAYLRGTRTPPLDEIEKIAAFYGYSGIDFFRAKLPRKPMPTELTAKPRLSPEAARQIFDILIQESGLSPEEYIENISNDEDTDDLDI